MLSKIRRLRLNVVENSVFNVLRVRRISTRLKRKCITTQINANKSYDKNVAKKMQVLAGLRGVHSVT